MSDMDDDGKHEIRMELGSASMHLADAITEGELGGALAALRDPMRDVVDAARAYGIPRYTVMSCLVGLAAHAVYGDQE